MLVVTTNIQTLQPTSASAFCFLLRTHWRLSASKDRGGQIICSSQEIPLMFDNVGEALVNHPQIYHGWYFYRQNMFGLWMFLMALLTLATQGVPHSRFPGCTRSMGATWCHHFSLPLPGVPQGDADVHAAALDEFVPSCGLSHAPTLALQVHLLAETGPRKPASSRGFPCTMWQTYRVNPHKANSKALIVEGWCENTPHFGRNSRWFMFALTLAKVQ